MIARQNRMNLCQLAASVSLSLGEALPKKGMIDATVIPARA
jgi:hypothetical protein